MSERFTRRDFIRMAGLGALGAAGAAALQSCTTAVTPAGGVRIAGGHEIIAHQHAPGAAVTPRTYAGFDPTRFLYHFDYGTESKLPSGQTLRQWTITAEDRNVEVFPGVFFPGWTLNGEIPGPTLRCTEGDRLRITFVNKGAHAHSLHFHGIHPPNMDGLEGVASGGTFVYEFDALPFGVHLYHCHTMPLKKHIHKGLYGGFIVDPKEPRPPANEMVMIMNAFDLDGDGENEFYAVNTAAFHYQNYPIPIKSGELNRIYLINMTEFDPINSFHLHAGMFRYYPTGTRPDQYFFTDTVMQCQGERGILEFSVDYPGRYMFHAHQSEFAELGWVGFFEAR